MVRESLKALGRYISYDGLNIPEASALSLGKLILNSETITSSHYYVIIQASDRITMIQKKSSNSLTAPFNNFVTVSP